ncbi:hypothetical protein [Streptomyces violaceus]|uniref:Uncharacterized protein n=1 Tax=Streptomyces violaceus TaxID=1936 RepID=A0ABY9UEX0_STRVL|nr:hypothetical protein [Streptomyces janthinus]WND21143.1 hypothetical protein RI060_29090 [Streptomyces janthinus]GGS47903.1 hypothetical protein GCM10010270_17440 [Streptomyces janthinus]
MGFFRRTENAADDQARTIRILDGIETAYAARTGDPVDGGPLNDFEEVVIEGAAPRAGDTYPPPGHGYPRR